MKNIFWILVVIIPTLGFGQKQETLHDILWSRVSNCYSMIEDMDEDGILDFDKIDDSKNGYLKITSHESTCGCICHSTVGAYKNSNGNYIILQSDYVGCSWVREISSNKDLKEVLPIDFGINSFTSEYVDSKNNYPVFLIDLEIPRIGTDTKVKIELVPFGLMPKGEDLICYGYKEEKPYKSLFAIQILAYEMSDTNTIDYLLNRSFDKISLADRTLISEELRTDGNGGRLKSIEEMSEYLNQLKNVYDLYYKLKTNELILGWNRNESRFFIKGEGEKIPQISFIEFLINNRYWGFTC